MPAASKQTRKAKRVGTRQPKLHPIKTASVVEIRASRGETGGTVMATATDKPWLKVTFDSKLPGAARSIRGQRISGRWIVFDKAQAGEQEPLFPR